MNDFDRLVHNIAKAYWGLNHRADKAEAAEALAEIWEYKQYSQIGLDWEEFCFAYFNMSGSIAYLLIHDWLEEQRKREDREEREGERYRITVK
jgi:hypothetical protein